MAIKVTLNGSHVSVDTDANAAKIKAIALAQANPDLVELAAQPPDQITAWFDGLSAARKANLLKAIVIKLAELDRRVALLEGR